MMGIAAAFFVSSLATAFAERLAISSGDCEIAFDSQTGAVLDMSYKGNPLGLKFRPDLCVVKYYNKALQPLKTSQMKCTAVREGGKITLSFRRPDSDADALEVSVRGNGNGFDVNAEIKNVSDDVLQAEFFTMFDFPRSRKGHYGSFYYAAHDGRYAFGGLFQERKRHVRAQGVVDGRVSGT